MIFSFLAYDYPLLWSPTPTPPSYLEFVEAHLRFLHAAPPLVPRLLHIIIAVALCGFIIKLHRPSHSNLLFDGASLVLFMCCVIVYVANVVKGLRTVDAGAYGGGDAAAEAGEGEGGLLNKADTLKVLSASNTIMALVLVGVLVLQAGQWYAEKKEQVEVDVMEAKRKTEAEKERNGNGNGNGHGHGHGHGNGHSSNGNGNGRRSHNKDASSSSPVSRKFQFQQQQLHEAARKRL